MKTSFVLMFIFLSFVGWCQTDKSLYFITGHPFGSEEQFESALWKYDRDSSALIKHTWLCGSDERLYNIKMYTEQGYFTLMKGNGVREFNNYYDSLLVFNINNMELKRVSVGKFDCGITANANNYLLILPNVSLIAIDLIQRKFDKKLLYNSYEINTLKYNDSIDLQLYENIYLTGFIGGEVIGSDYILTYSREVDGFLEIVVTGDRNMRPCFPYELPEEYRFRVYARHTIPINNDCYFVISGKKETKMNVLGKRQVIIFDKKTSKWHELILLGTLPRIRGFEDWLCGYIGDDSESLLNKKLPGSGIWKDRETGLSPEERYEGMYAPGILYFYNPSTDIYFELKTDQADSEVVLIQNDKVIYRVYDELYEAGLLNGKELVDAKLLLKDDRVPDIHWVFYSMK